MNISNITILGGDLRHTYAARYLSSLSYDITCFSTPSFPHSANIRIAESVTDALKDASAVLLSPDFPPDELIGQLSDGMVIFYTGIPAALEEQLTLQHCTMRCLSDSPRFAARNALLTAEGLLAELIRYTPFSLRNSSVLLLGYGHCGHAIGSLLSCLKARTYVLEQDSQKQRMAEHNGLLALSPSEKSTILPHCNLVINTIPQTVLTDDDLRHLSGNCHVFDIASAPFGFSSDITSKYFLPYFRLPGLPGKFCPQTAGSLIGSTIERMIRHDL